MITSFTSERITLRTIRIRDVNGAMHVIPNSSITTVSNLTRGLSRYMVDVPVSDKADPKAVFATLEEIGKELAEDPRFKSDILQPLEILGLESPTRLPVVKARITSRPPASVAGRTRAQPANPTALRGEGDRAPLSAAPRARGSRVFPGMKLAIVCVMMLTSAMGAAAQVGAPPAPPPQMQPNPGMAPNAEMLPNPGMAPNTEMAPNPEMAPGDTPARPGGPDIGDTRLEPTPPNAVVE